jgi:hypothetical protein
MSAEWILQTYAYDPKRLAAIVGNARAVRVPRELADDDRAEIPMADAVREIASGKLKRAHAMAYRIALEAAMSAIGKRAHPRISTYALKPDVGRVATKLGMRTLGDAWNKPRIAFPSAKLARAIDWPMATTLTAPQVSAAAAETTRLPRSLDARVLELMPRDPSFATDVAEVLRALAKATNNVARAKAAMMILVDGEQ